MTAETILVVEDSAEVREFIADSLLRPKGYTVLTAADGATGLHSAQDFKPDLIIADQNMPGLTGLSLAERARDEFGLPPVILITAEGSEALAQQALRARVADYLTKPFDSDELLAAVRRALDWARAQYAQTHLAQQLQDMQTLVAIGHSVTAVLDLDQVLEKLVNAAVTLTGAEESALLLLDERTNELVMRAAKNFDDQFARTFRLPSTDSLAGQVIQTGEPILLDNTIPQKIKSQYLVRSLVYVPITVSEQTIGVLGIDNRQAGRPFTGPDQRVLQALADYAAVAIENARLYARSEAQRIELETFLHETEDGVVVVGPDNRLILINPAASDAFGVNQPNATGQLFDSVIFNAQARGLFNGQSRGGEIQLEDGRVFNAHVTPIASVGRALVMQDITHLKKLDRIKSEFVTAVSHDLRSPLTAILGYVDLIQRGGPVNEQQAEFIARVRQSVHAINSLITDLLDLGRIEAGFDTQKEPTSLAAIARYAVDAFKPQADAKQQLLVVSLPEGLPRVFANTLRLRQMVANLLDNAIKYTPPGGDVHITVSADGDQLILMVSDGGIGIAPADQPYIFDKFYRASNVRVGYAGTGLGLSIVKSIVEAHSGRIWLDSKLNQGTTFTVVLPKHKE